MEPKSNGKLIFLTVLITALVTAVSVFFALNKFSGIGMNQNNSQTGAPAETGNQGSKDRKIAYWQAPMNPTEIYDAPGKSLMGMDLVPVYEDDTADDSKNSDRKVAYWKAPMNPTEIYEQPGKSNMGMDLVPVYEDEIVGGVDIKIDPVVEQNMGLKTEKVLRTPIEHTIRTYGHITFDETRVGIVSQKYAGWIEKLYADYTGFFVKKGEAIYEVYSPALLASQEEYLSAYKNYQKNKSGLNRQLLESAKKRLSYYDIDDREITAIEKSGKVKRSLIVRSPFTGVITHKNIIEGAFVKSGASLYTISDLSHVWVEAHIFEYEQNLVFKGQEVEMTLSYNPGKIYKGTISYIFPYLQTKTRDVIIRIDFKNDQNELKPDMYAKINIKIGSGRKAISISSEAVIHTGVKKIVFVSKGKGRYTPREITTGVYLTNGKVEILSGLIQGDIVVISGQFLLDSESKLKEAIQKMLEAKSSPVDKPADKKNSDDFFNDMESKDDFFKDME